MGEEENPAALWHWPVFFSHAQALQKGAPLPDTTPPTANNVNTAKFCGRRSHISPRQSGGRQGGGQCTPVKSNWSEKCDFYLDIVRRHGCQHNQSAPIQPRSFSPRSVFEISRHHHRLADCSSSSALHFLPIKRSLINTAQCHLHQSCFIFCLFDFQRKQKKAALTQLQPLFRERCTLGVLGAGEGSERREQNQFEGSTCSLDALLALAEVMLSVWKNLQ